MSIFHHKPRLALDVLLILSLCSVVHCSARNKRNFPSGRAIATTTQPPARVEPPSSLSYEEAEILIRTGALFESPAPDYQGSPCTFTIDPKLPSGLQINSANGIISGLLATVPFETQRYSVTATNSVGSTKTEITLKVLDWWDQRSETRLRISVGNSASVAAVDLPVQVHLNPSELIDTGLDTIHCSNLRFVGADNQTSLNHWIEECSPDSITVWVKVPQLTAKNSATLFLYFTTENGKSSNGYETFDFFDGMESDRPQPWLAGVHNNYACSGNWKGHGFSRELSANTGSAAAAFNGEPNNPRTGSGALFLWVNCGEDFLVQTDTYLSANEKVSYKANFYYHTSHPNYSGIDPLPGSQYGYSFGSYTPIGNTGSGERWTKVEGDLSASTIYFYVADRDGIDVNAVRLHIDDLFVRKVLAVEPTVEIVGKEYLW